MEKFLITAADGASYGEAQTLMQRVRGYLLQKQYIAHVVSDVDLPNFRADVVIAIGGDGTIMRALKKYARYDVPVFGINGGDVGFLAAAERESWEKDLDQVIAGEGVIEERLALSVEVVDQEHPPQKTSFGPFANEVLLWNSHNQGDFEVAIGGVGYFGEVMRGRGVLVATATGSTAQNVSEGGPIILPPSRNVAVTPMNPAMLNVRPLVTDALERGETITLVPRWRKGEDPLELWADGERLRPRSRHLGADSMQQGVAEVELHNWVNITASEKPLRLMTFGGPALARALRNKKGFAR